MCWLINMGKIQCTWALLWALEKFGLNQKGWFQFELPTPVRFICCYIMRGGVSLSSVWAPPERYSPSHIVTQVRSGTQCSNICHYLDYISHRFSLAHDANICSWSSYTLPLKEWSCANIWSPIISPFGNQSCPWIVEGELAHSSFACSLPKHPSCSGPSRRVCQP